MPTYEYECPSCGTFEVFQSMTEKPLRKCPHCKAGKVQRLIGAGAGILFKGSGFYQTDYRSESYKAAAKKDAPAPETKPDSGAKSCTGCKKADASCPASGD